MQAESVVVGLQRDEVAAQQAVLHHGGQDAKVGGKGHAAAVRGLDAVAAARHVVAGRKRADLERTNIKRVSPIHGGGLHSRWQRPAGIQCVQCVGTAVYGDGILF